MAMVWGVFWGVVLGAWWPGYGGWGSYIGGFLGFFIGLTLQFVIKQQVTASHADLRQQLVAQLKGSQENARAHAVNPPAPIPPATAPTQSVSAPHDVFVPASAVVHASAASNAGASPPPEFVPSYQPSLPYVAPRSTRPSGLENPKLIENPNVLDAAFKVVKDWFLGGNTIVRVGLVILFIGLSFLARYVAAAGLLPVEFRLAAIGAVGIALLAIGFRKRVDKPGFALALQGTGVAVMYLTVFAAFRLYAMMPPLAAFGLMIIVCALSCVLALMQNSQALAVAAFAGGFAVPILLSNGQGSHVGLFSYYTVLNLAILFIAQQRSWRMLNLVGFAATFGIATAWGALKFAPNLYATTQPFLIGFLLIYVATVVLYARNTPTKLGNAVDSSLVFGTPLIAFGLQVGLTRQFELGTAFSALGFSALYLLLAAFLSRCAGIGYRLLIECFIALGVGFATLAVPLALDAQWTSAVWALEGAAAFWVGMRQARWMPRAFGILLQAIAALAFVTGVDANISAWPLLNPVFMGALLIALPALLLSWWLRQPLPHTDSSWARSYATVEALLGKPAYIYGFVWWCAALLLEISRVVPGKEVGTYTAVVTQSTAQLLSMLAVMISALISVQIGVAKKWSVAIWPGRSTLVVMLIIFMMQLAIGARVLHTPAWLIWAGVLVLHFWILRIVDTQIRVNSGITARDSLSYATHVGGVWLITLLLADCLWFWIGKGDLWNTSWASVVLLISGIGVLLTLSLWAGRANQVANLPNFRWPLNPYASAYYWHAALPLVVLVFLGALGVAVTSSGRTEPLPYIPLLNPTDIAIALGLSALVIWRRVVVQSLPLPVAARPMRRPIAWAVLAALAFVAINTVWLRVAHHFFDVRWNVSALFDSFVVQTGYAILWSLLALSLMLMAGRRQTRVLWLTGAGLLALVVIKLLLIDLSNYGGAERIIAFIVVGVLMLVVGYFVPLPPAAKDDL